jgi:hypothetical protein
MEYTRGIPAWPVRFLHAVRCSGLDARTRARSHLSLSLSLSSLSLSLFLSLSAPPPLFLSHTKCLSHTQTRTRTSTRTRAHTRTHARTHGDTVATERASVGGIHPVDAVPATLPDIKNLHRLTDQGPTSNLRWKNLCRMHSCEGTYRTRTLISSGLTRKRTNLD